MLAILLFISTMAYSSEAAIQQSQFPNKHAPARLKKELISGSAASKRGDRAAALRQASVSRETPKSAGWRRANITHYTSYPLSGSEECLEYSGCQWAGLFAALPSKMSEEWVQSNNIAAVHSDAFGQYKLKTLRLRKNAAEIDVKVYDMCSDADCDGCCTRNSASTGFLIDLEIHTAQRFGIYDGEVEWTCLDCNF